MHLGCPLLQLCDDVLAFDCLLGDANSIWRMRDGEAGRLKTGKMLMSGYRFLSEGLWSGHRGYGLCERCTVLMSFLKDRLSS